MAIVKNNAGFATAEDKSFCVPSVEGSGNPNSTVTPQFAGQIYLDTTQNVRWRAVDKTNDSWVAMEAEVVT
jgi:hypothetical protein